MDIYWTYIYIYIYIPFIFQDVHVWKPVANLHWTDLIVPFKANLMNRNFEDALKAAQEQTGRKSAGEFVCTVQSGPQSHQFISRVKETPRISGWNDRSYPFLRPFIRVPYLHFGGFPEFFSKSKILLAGKRGNLWDPTRWAQKQLVSRMK